MEGSLDIYTSANSSTNDIPGINPNGTDDDFVPTRADLANPQAHRGSGGMPCCQQLHEAIDS